MSTEYIKNNNILIIDRLKENKDIQCGNRVDKLVDNYCYPTNTDSYIASCPIRYTMYKIDDQYKCYKNCPDSFIPSDIQNINYQYNGSGKKCVQKDYIHLKNISNTNSPSSIDDTVRSTDKIILYNREIIDVSCNNPHDIITNSKQCIQYIKTLGDVNDLHRDECPAGSIILANKKICIGQTYESICKPGYDKIDNSCYKSCNNDFMPVDIIPLSTSNGFIENDTGSKCISNTIISSYTPSNKQINTQPSVLSNITSYIPPSLQSYLS